MKLSKIARKYPEQRFSNHEGLVYVFSSKFSKYGDGIHLLYLIDPETDKYTHPWMCAEDLIRDDWELVEGVIRS